MSISSISQRPALFDARSGWPRRARPAELDYRCFAQVARRTGRCAGTSRIARTSTPVSASGLAGVTGSLLRGICLTSSIISRHQRDPLERAMAAAALEDPNVQGLHTSRFYASQPRWCRWPRRVRAGCDSLAELRACRRTATRLLWRSCRDQLLRQPSAWLSGEKAMAFRTRPRTRSSRRPGISVSRSNSRERCQGVLAA